MTTEQTQTLAIRIAAARAAKDAAEAALNAYARRREILAVLGEEAQSLIG